MLVLTRKAEEDIYIGEGIRIVVLKIKGGRCTLGIDATADIPIQRGEIRSFTHKGSSFDEPCRHSHETTASAVPASSWETVG